MIDKIILKIHTKQLFQCSYDMSIELNVILKNI